MLVQCNYCYAVVETDGDAAHGIGNPCPLKVSTDEAYIARLNAEAKAADAAAKAADAAAAAHDATRMAHIRSGVGNERIVEAMERLSPPEDDE